MCTRGRTAGIDGGEKNVVDLPDGVGYTRGNGFTENLVF
jgi:hypothetical protein